MSFRFTRLKWQAPCWPLTPAVNGLTVEAACQLESSAGTCSLGTLAADAAAQTLAGAVSAASHSGSQGACGRHMPLPLLV